MAAQSPCGWSWNSSSYTTATIKCSSNSSNLSSFCTTPRKRPRFTASSSSSSKSSASSNAKQGQRKSAKLESTGPNPSTLVKISKGNGSQIERRVTTLSFKSLFGRRSLWLRIFFASKKVRIILLLNVITVVYDGKAKVAKELFEAIDDENNSITLRVVEGHGRPSGALQELQDHHSSLSKRRGLLGALDFEYEKVHGDVEDPHTLLQLAVDLSAAIGSHLST